MPRCRRPRWSTSRWGVLLAIEPWNFPYYQIARIIAPQLSAGNTMLLKHASNVPQCAAAFEKLMLDAGLPKGGFQNLYATRAQIETIIKDPRVHGLAFTGVRRGGGLSGFSGGQGAQESDSGTGRRRRLRGASRCRSCEDRRLGCFRTALEWRPGLCVLQSA